MVSARSVRHHAYMVLMVLLVWFAVSVPVALVVGNFLATTSGSFEPAPVRAAVPTTRRRQPVA